MSYADVTSSLASGNAQLILAVCVVVLAGVCWYLYKEGKAKDKIIYDLQDKRLQDALSTAGKYNDAMGEFSRTTTLLTGKLVGKD